MENTRLIDFVINNVPAGVIVLDDNMRIAFSNRQAELFFKRFKPPEELASVCKRIFKAMSASKLKVEFPGEIDLSKKLDGSSSIWTFRFRICEEPPPCVSIFITEESLSSKIDLNKIRRQFSLTRRETDVVRRVLNGLKNIAIAEELGISEQTVKDYLSNVYMKLGCVNRVALISLLLNLPQFPDSKPDPVFG